MKSRSREILERFEALAGTAASDSGLAVEVRRTSGNRPNIPKSAVSVNGIEHRFDCGRDTDFFLRGLSEMALAVKDK